MKYLGLIGPLVFVAAMWGSVAHAPVGQPVSLGTLARDIAPTAIDLVPILPSPYTGSLQAVTLSSLWAAQPPLAPLTLSANTNPLTVTLTTNVNTSIVGQFNITGQEGDTNFTRLDPLTNPGGAWEWTTQILDSGSNLKYATVIANACTNTTAGADTCSISFGALGPGEFYQGALGNQACVSSYVANTLGYATYVGNLNLILNGVSACSPLAFPDQVTAVGTGYHVGDVLLATNVGGSGPINGQFSAKVLLTNNSGGAGIGGVLLAQIVGTAFFNPNTSITGFTFTGGFGTGFTIGNLTVGSTLWSANVPIPGLVVQPNVPTNTMGNVAVINGYSLAMGSNTVIDPSSNVTAGTVKPKVLTVSTLATCNSGAKGTESVVSDATAPTYLATLTGGGTVATPVFCNGTAWVSY